MNRSTLRDAVYTRLADPAINGVYATAQVDDALDAAFAEVAPLFAVESIYPVTVAADAASFTDPSGEGSRILDIATPDGRPLAQADADDPRPGSPYALLRWRRFAGTVQLNRPVRDAEAGAWTLQATAPPTLPADDATAWKVPATIEPAIVSLAAASLIRSRLATDSRRGHTIDVNARMIAAQLAEDARAVIRQHKRTARGSVMT